MTDHNVEQEIIGDIWTSTESWENERNLVSFGSRGAGTESETKAKEYMLQKMKEYGLSNVRAEPFEYTGWKRGTAKLEILKPEKREIETISLVFCPSTPEGGIEGEIISVGDGTPEDFQKRGHLIRGRIVLATSRTPSGLRRPLHRREKFGRSIELGAKAFIYVNSEPGMLQKTGSLRTNMEAEIPGVGVSYEEGTELMRMAEEGPVVTRITTNNTTSRAISWNLIGEIKGSKEPDEIVIVTAHYDGHDITPSAIDNATGAAVLLEVGRVLGKHKESLKRTVWILSCSCEQMGLTGSTVLVNAHPEDLRKIRLVLNMDGPGTPGRKGFATQGFSELVQYLQNLSKELGYSMRITDDIAIASDHFPFALKGVPAIYMTTESKSEGWGHTAAFGLTRADTLDKVDPFDIQEAGMVMARVVLRVANDEAFPGRHRSVNEVKEILRGREIDVIMKATKQWERFFPE